MGERTHISWCDHTFNPWIGCMRVSPACDGCYAAYMMDERFGRVQFGGPGVGVGTRSRTSPGNWRQPLRWNRRAGELGIRPFVFGGSLMDPFDKHVPKEWRRDYFDHVIRPTPNLVWLLLTKRPQLIVDLADEAGGLPPNVALGATAEDQTRWDQNIGELCNAKAVTGALFAFASCEPLLWPINPRRAPVTSSMRNHFAFSAARAATFDPIHPRQDPRFKLDWIITGGESDQGGHMARPSHWDWFRRIRDACAETGTPYHHKQNGEWGDSGWLSAETAEGRHRRELARMEGSRTGKWDPETDTFKLGLLETGRLLDDTLHDARPEVRAALPSPPETRP